VYIDSNDAGTDACIERVESVAAGVDTELFHPELSVSTDVST